MSNTLVTVVLLKDLDTKGEIMVTVYDVEAGSLIKKAAGALKEQNLVAAPKWMGFVKSGTHVQRAPIDPDFWYMRCASLLRTIYMDGPIGTNVLRELYGGRKKMGSARSKHTRASGAIIRKAMQQLEAASLVEKKPEGRIIAKKGRAFLDAIARTV